MFGIIFDDFQCTFALLGSKYFFIVYQKRKKKSQDAKPAISSRYFGKSSMQFIYILFRNMNLKQDVLIYILFYLLIGVGDDTLNSMASAVENSAVVIIFITEKYYRSQNCRAGIAKYIPLWLPGWVVCK